MLYPIAITHKPLMSVVSLRDVPVKSLLWNFSDLAKTPHPLVLAYNGHFHSNMCSIIVKSGH